MVRNSKLQSAIIKTICYADIFDYPLTSREIYRYLIFKPSSFSPSFFSITAELKKNYKSINKNGRYYILPNRSKLIEKRKNRKRWSEKKILIARRVGDWLKLIPFVKAVAVTGALSMKNAKKKDDIDLMIITEENRLWLTRFLVVMLVSLIAKRRRPTKQFNDPTTKRERFNNAICLNLFLDETALQIPKSKRNLYTAHEVAQTKFLWSKNGISERLFFQNIWISGFLPNIKLPKSSIRSIKQLKHLKIINKLESLFYKLQLTFMEKKRTRETVSSHYAYFHPRDTGKIVAKKYQNNINKYL